MALDSVRAAENSPPAVRDLSLCSLCNLPSRFQVPKLRDRLWGAFLVSAWASAQSLNVRSEFRLARLTAAMNSGNGKGCPGWQEES